MATKTAEPEAPATLPSEEELDAALATLSAAITAVNNVRWRAWRIARPARCEHGRDYAIDPHDQVPTFEDIGRLYVWASDAMSRLDEARGYVRALTASRSGVAVGGAHIEGGWNEGDGLLYDLNLVAKGVTWVGFDEEDDTDPSDA